MNIHQEPLMCVILRFYDSVIHAAETPMEYAEQLTEATTEATTEDRGFCSRSSRSRSKSTVGVEVVVLVGNRAATAMNH